jgi:hypothetical protein
MAGGAEREGRVRPSDEAIREVLGRLLRRLKAKDLLLVAHRVQQSPPERVFSEIVATNGVEIEAEHLLKELKP